MFAAPALVLATRCCRVVGGAFVAAQVVNEGRHQGGRAPYGYVVVDGGPYPNPRKAAEGFRLRVLEIDEVAAEVVRRIFNEYVEGNG